MVTCEGSRPTSAEQRLKKLGIKLSEPPEPFGTYAEEVQRGICLKKRRTNNENTDGADIP